jgi:hypothetical protein
VIDVDLNASFHVTTPWWGVVNLPRVRRKAGRCDDRSETSRRILGEFRDFAPHDESSRELLSIHTNTPQALLLLLNRFPRV